MSNDNLTIKEAKDLMRPKLRTGCVCPACGQPVKLYKRPLTSSMAYGLILIYNQLKNHQFTHSLHLENFFADIPGLPASIRGDVPKLRFWGLIEQDDMPTRERRGNPNNGCYHITKSGIAFVEDNLAVQSHVLIYNNKFYGFPKDSGAVTIKEALKNKFNYEEVVKL